jgi:hypothetical protein
MNAQQNGDSPAYPTTDGDWGLTKRELFAIKLMAALISHPNADLTKESKAFAAYAVSNADALLAELSKEGGSK